MRPQATEPQLFDTSVMQASDDPNPCVRLYGLGPEGERCKTCIMLRKFASPNRAWYKCMHRRSPVNPNSMGKATTDHRVRWNACAKYVDRDEVEW